jgi:thiol:disulfide interchange protein DsbD
LLAFAGGMILNLMPCVLPVLSLKILGFLREAGGDPKAARRHGLLYSAGVLFSFWVMAGLLIALRAGGHSVGWGFQLQSPIFVAILAAVFVLLALNLFGVFEIGVSLTRLGGVEGGAFAGGVLAVAAATPCTAPFMGAALGFAVTRPPLEALAVFTALGLGMVWPYAALTASPRLLRWVPKPGPWMLTLKRIFGAALLATAFWLVWIFARLTLPSTAEEGAWEPFTPARVEQLRGEGRPVFLDFTADWCLTCQVNERFALRDARVVRRFLERNVAALSADWTRRDPDVTRALESFGRTGVPLYVYYPPGASSRPIILPALLTPGIVLDAINENKET